MSGDDRYKRDLSKEGENIEIEKIERFPDINTKNVHCFVSS